MQPQPSTAAAAAATTTADLSLPRKPSCCYIADDDEYDIPGACDRSLDDMEAGFSSSMGHHRLLRCWSFVNGYAVKGSSSFVCSPRFVGRSRYYEEEMTMGVEQHFLDSCFLCGKHLRNNSDIFMYRGDTPFCSEECREEQMELDHQREMNQNLSSSMRALRNREQQEGGSKSPDSPRLRTGTVAVA